MIITQTPLRISLLGGGTDFPGFYQEHGGCVLTMAIDRYIYCVIKERFDDLIYLNYAKKEIVENIDQIENDLIREALRLTGVTKGVEITFLSDIPSSGGSGLGSSSSFLVGLLNALHLYLGESVNCDVLAQEACQIEIDILKNPIGVQDQYIASFGGLKFMSFTHEGVKVHQLNTQANTFSDLKNYIMVFFTGQTRQANTVLTEQKQKIGQNIELLKQMADQAKQGRLLIEKGSIRKLGKLLDETWQLKKKLASNITNPHIDRMYEKAIESGALGGKISGAGNGGFLTLFVPPQNHSAVRKALSEFKEMVPGISTDGSKSIFNIRR